MIYERLVQAEYMRRLRQKQPTAVIAEFLSIFAEENDLANKLKKEDNTKFFKAITNVAERPIVEKKRRNKGTTKPVTEKPVHIGSENSSPEKLL